jgi:tetratricopeptide (TPR) repeat protein
MIWLFLLLLIGPCLVTEVPREIGRWKLAEAISARERSHKEQAYELLESVRNRFPDNPELLIQRASWRLADGQEEQALADCDQAVELAKDNYQILELRSQFLQYVGRHADALKDLKAVEAMSQRSGRPSRAHALNSLAYGQALAQVDLDEALRHANQAVSLAPSEPAIRDTYGYILYLKRQYAAAFKELEVAAAGMEAQATKQSLRRDISDKHAALFEIEIGLPGAADPNRSVAVVRYHRALVLLALGREKQAEEDLAKVRKLIGHEPDEHLF